LVLRRLRRWIRRCLWLRGVGPGGEIAGTSAAWRKRRLSSGSRRNGREICSVVCGVSAARCVELGVGRGR